MEYDTYVRKNVNGRWEWKIVCSDGAPARTSQDNGYRDETHMTKRGAKRHAKSIIRRWSYRSEWKQL